MDTEGSAARTAAHPFPFPYFGAGEARYRDTVEVYVRFARPPGHDEGLRIVGNAPAPLRGHVRWTEGGRQLAVGNAGTAVEEIGRAYPAGVTAFNRAVGAWLRAAHAVCPVQVAYRPPDDEAGGTLPSAWHAWSIGRIGTLTPEFGRVAAADDARCDGGTSDSVFVTRGVLRMARDSGAHVPGPLLDWLEPGNEEVAALAAGDGPALEWLTAALPPGRRAVVAERLTGALRPGSAGEVAAFEAAARRLVAHPVVVPRVVAALVRGALAARATGQGAAVAALLDDLARLAAGDPRVARRLRADAWELAARGRSASAAELLAFAGEEDGGDDGAPPAAPSARSPRAGQARRRRSGHPPRGPVGQVR